MRRLFFRLVIAAVTFAAIAVTGIGPRVMAQEPAPAATADAPPETPATPDPGPVKNRLVVVGAPKVYDDLYLRGLLTSLQNQLANVHGVDQATLLSHIGVAQGADLRQSSAAISASGPSTPQTSAFSLAPGVPAFSYPPGYPGTAGSTAFPTGTATTTTPGTTTTINSMTPAAPTPPAPSLALPAISSLGQSSLDTYNESLQLSAEITNTELLLQGALSDTLDSGGRPKTTVTIGFPITVEAPSLTDKELAGAVAEVHVSVCSNSTDDAPSIVTLLPRERTYNVASLVDRNFMGSASAILGGMVNVGGGFLWSHKRYYLVQQQETVAFLAPDQTGASCNGKKHATFAWQIRPVLGKEFIRPGNSVNFVQFAIPEVIDSGEATKPIGRACVSVIWRKPALTGLFRKKSDEYLGDAIAGREECYPINYYNTLADTSLSVTDIGQGAVTVQVTGTFLPGTTVRLGNTYLPPDSIASTHGSLTFTAPATAIVAAGQVYLVGRDGRELEAIHHQTPAAQLQMQTPVISPYSDTQSLVKISFKSPDQAISADIGAGSSPNPNNDPWVVVIGGKVFGLSDAPFFSQTANEIQVIVPTALIQSSPRVELRRLLWSDAYYRAAQLIPADTFSKAAPSVASTSILSTQNGLLIGLVGTGLDHAKMVFPTCPACTANSTGPTFMLVNLPKPEEKKAASGKEQDKEDPKDKKKEKHKDKKAPADPTDGLKQLAFCRKQATSDTCDPNFPTLVVDVPKLDDAKPKPSLDKHDPVAVNTRQVTITGSMLDQVVAIEHAKTSLAFRLASPKDAGKSPSLVVDLPDSIAKVPGGYSLLITFADKSVTGYVLTIQKSGS
jgi:hypothetical protein